MERALSVMNKYNVTFACGHRNIAYSNRIAEDGEARSPYRCMRCTPETPIHKRLTQVDGAGEVTIVPMLAERNMPVYMVFVKKISDGEWRLTHRANHPLHALWMIQRFYENAKYIETDRALRRVGV